MNLIPLKTDVPPTDHTIASHIDTDATGAQLNILVGGDDAARTFLGLGPNDSPTFLEPIVKALQFKDEGVIYTEFATMPVEGQFRILRHTDNIGGILDFSGITTPSKTFTFPDSDGTIALTSDLYTDEEAQDAIGGILTDSTTIDFTYDDEAGTITAATIDGGIDHDQLANVHQDVNTDAGPTFASLTVDGTTTSNKINLGGGLTAFVLNGVSLDAIVGATSQIATELHYVALQHSNTALAGTRFMYGRSRGTLASPTIVVENDTIAAIDAAAYDGTDYVLAGEIDFEVDGEPGGNDMPGRIVLRTTSDGGILPTTRWTIDSVGCLKSGSDGTSVFDITTAGTITGATIAGANANWDAAYGWGDHSSAGYQAQGDVLDDLNTLGANSADGEFLVGTGAGTLAWESGTTARASLGLGIGDSPTFTTLNLSGLLDLPTSTDAAGQLRINSQCTLHTFHHPTGGEAIPNGKNVFIGENCGNFTMGSDATSSAEASYNSAIGFYVLFNNTLGHHNSAIGYSNLVHNTTGNYNSAIGSDSLRENTTGVCNMGVGSYSLRQNITGDNNVAIGFSALSNMTAGDGNIAIGMYAGFRQTTVSNLLIIDNRARADIATEATNAIIYGTMAASPANQILKINASIFMPNLKSGATQAAAGAAADEVWKTNGHASLPNNVLMIGV